MRAFETVSEDFSESPCYFFITTSPLAQSLKIIWAVYLIAT